MPPFKPFRPFESFLRQGMQNTNQNINQPYSFTNSLTGMNPQNMYGFTQGFTPPSQGFTPPAPGGGFPSPGTGFGGQGVGGGTGGGGIETEPGGTHWGSETDEGGGHGEISPAIGSDLIWGIGGEVEEEPDYGFGFVGDEDIGPGKHLLGLGSFPSYGGDPAIGVGGRPVSPLDINQDGNIDVADMTLAQEGGNSSLIEQINAYIMGGGLIPTEELQEGWQWQFVNGTWEPVDVSGAGDEEVVEEDDYGAGWGGYQGGGDYHIIEPELSGWDKSVYGGPQDTGLEFDQTPMPDEQPIPGYEWQWINGEWQEVYIGGLSTDISTTGAGRGLKGTLAKQLYYPSTTGGFASTGSGISGGKGSNMLADLLKNIG